MYSQHATAQLDSIFYCALASRSGKCLIPLPFFGIGWVSLSSSSCTMLLPAFVWNPCLKIAKLNIGHPRWHQPRGKWQASRTRKPSSCQHLWRYAYLQLLLASTQGYYHTDPRGSSNETEPNWYQAQFLFVFLLIGRCFGYVKR